eukprot:TRINITY_DN96727_c0_g1_i1.p1 TRINITY_DN96727_c0_g1~~TRINITY_DN96727_c0_g1_i1.p1  ORF type:complete len:103 (-),score=14.74 TRINITY_DN96727_c0_g1_i1:42-350(-)
MVRRSSSPLVSQLCLAAAAALTALLMSSPGSAFLRASGAASSRPLIAVATSVAAAGMPFVASAESAAEAGQDLTPTSMMLGVVGIGAVAVFGTFVLLYAFRK